MIEAAAGPFTSGMAGRSPGPFWGAWLGGRQLYVANSTLDVVIMQPLRLPLPWR